jgi:hypothetical protein
MTDAENAVLLRSGLWLLVEILEAAISGPAVHFYEFDSFRLDVARRILSRDGEVTPLTAKAFDIVTIPREGYCFVAAVRRFGADGAELKTQEQAKPNDVAKFARVRSGRSLAAVHAGHGLRDRRAPVHS